MPYIAEPDIDFSKIVLTKEERKLFKRFKKEKRVKLDWSEARPLTHYDLITQNVTGQNSIGDSMSDGTYKLSSCGKKYFEYLRITELEKISSEIRGWITTVIAVLAFILSIIALRLNIPK